MTWLQDMLRVSKPIIAMCHLAALPGDPGFDVTKGLDWVVERARKDLRALQDGGVDAVMFSNEASLPYLTKVEPITYVTMARIIGELRREIRVPYGVNVLWDPEASIDLAMATGALFVREIFSGVYASDFGLWNTNCGQAIRHQHAIHAEHVRLLYNIVPEAAAYLGHRDIGEIARSTVFNHQPDALCVSGLVAGAEASLDTLRFVKEAVPGTPVLANTGVRIDNVQQQLQVADGAVTATTFKRDGYIWNEVDFKRVQAFMETVKACR
jgi:membrane complex biogenesis BtpA family protein